jgi:hypothetical protein
VKKLSHPNPLEDRVQFKLDAAKNHLERLKILENGWPGQNFALTNNDHNAKMHIEMEIDEILYHLVGVKDALLQQINSELNLGLAIEKVKLDTINKELNLKKPSARDVTKEICSMMSDEHDPRWLINELHNYSKHRAMLIKQKTAIAEGPVLKPSLVHPRTNDAIRDDNGNQVPVVEYLEQSYAMTEDLQRTVRSKIQKYHI